MHHRQSFHPQPPSHRHETQKRIEHTNRHTNYAPSAVKLVSLLNQHPTNNIRISCNKKISVIIEKIAARKHSPLLSDRKRKRKVGIFTGGGVTLQTCFQKYLCETQQQYVLTSTAHHTYQSMQPRGKSLSAKTRANSQTSIGQQYGNSSKKLIEKPSSNYFSNQGVEGAELDHKSMHPYTSQRKNSQKEMFVVEQMVGESIQSESRESLPKKHNQPIKEERSEMLRQEIKNNLNFVTSKYLQQIGRNDPQTEDKANASLCQHRHSLTKQALDQPLTKQALDQKQNIDQGNHHAKGQVQRNARPLIDNPPVSKDKAENPKFSFAEMMRKGLIQHESIKMAKQESFKLAGDEQIQNAKNMAKELLIPAGEMSEMSELSSIISCHFKEEIRKDLQLDSIKNEIEKISNYFPPKKTDLKQIQTDLKQIQTEQHQKVEINILSQQHENNMKDLVEISQQPLQSNRSEYFVRYNFNEKKGSTTDVIRISPLKFRKKEEVVKHFVKARIISKQSNSINIP